MLFFVRHKSPHIRIGVEAKSLRRNDPKRGWNHAICRIVGILPPGSSIQKPSQSFPSGAATATLGMRGWGGLSSSYLRVFWVILTSFDSPIATTLGSKKTTFVPSGFNAL